MSCIRANYSFRKNIHNNIRVGISNNVLFHIFYGRNTFREHYIMF